MLSRMVILLKLSLLVGIFVVVALALSVLVNVDVTIIMPSFDGVLSTSSNWHDQSIVAAIINTKDNLAFI